MKQLKTFFVRTYGCQMNELDTEIMIGLLEDRGLSQVHQEHDADLVLLNTCSVRDLAERKVMGKLGILGKNRKSSQMIGVTGCMANAKKGSIFQKVPHLDFILGTNNIHNLNDVIDEVLATGQQKILADDRFTEELEYAHARRDDPLKAKISIIRGCDKYCTYCVVPYTRGPEVSRHPRSIIEECKMLVDKGYKEFTLLGQNVNSYGKDQPEWNMLFHELLYELDKIPGMGRIRFLTSHPVDITYELMTAIRDLKSVCKFVHFPVQSGSTRILKKMHRIYTLEQYLEKVHTLRSLVPNVALGTDIIVGFPTETDEEFQQTYDVLNQIRYDVGYLYAYSARKGTPAMRWKDDIAEEVKQDRLQKLIALQTAITREKLHQKLGETVEVLVDGHHVDDPNLLKGRTDCWKKVIFRGETSLMGSLQQVEIHSVTHETLHGSLKTRLSP